MTRRGMLWAAIGASAADARGGVLRVFLRAEPKTLNPVIAVDAASRDVIRRMHADLVSIDRSTQQTVPALAESWKRSRDGRTYQLKLRPRLRFSDGHPFTADDVVFSFAVYTDEKTASPQRDLLLVAGKAAEVRKLAEDVVEFRLAEPYAAAERLFDTVAMLPRHKLEPFFRAGRMRAAWAMDTPPGDLAGMGPFRLKEHRPGVGVVLERNPYFWRNGTPLLDGIEFRALADEDTQLARFVAGEADILTRLSPDAATYLQSRGLEVTDLGPGLEYNFLCFNLSPASPRLRWFSNVAFRQALSLAVDRAAICKIAFGGRAAPLWGHVSPGNRLWRNTKLPSPPVSVERARLLLAGNGYSRDSAGRLLDEKGTPVEFSILVSTSSPERNRMAALLQADFQKLGIRVTIAPLEFRSLINRVLDTRQFDTCLLGLGGGDADPNPEMNVWLSSGAMHLWNPGQRQPATSWEAEIDRLMREQMITLDSSRRRTLYERVQQIAVEQLPMIFLASPHVVVARRPEVRGFRPSIMDHQTLWNAHELSISRSGR